MVIAQDWHPKGHASFASSHPGRRPLETVEVGGVEQVLWPDHCVQGTDGAVVLVGGDPSVTLNGSLGGTMTSSLTYSVPNITLGATGGNFQVGGTLSVGANQTAGDYSGTFNVTANYQ